MYIHNLYGKRDSQTKFEANPMKNGKVSFEARGGRGGRGRGRRGGGGGNMSTLIQILNLYATRDSQTKFEGNRIKKAKFIFYSEGVGQVTPGY